MNKLNNEFQEFADPRSSESREKDEFSQSKDSNDNYSITGGSNSDFSDEYTPGCFEGPEKTMEVCFSPGKGVEQGLRSLTRAQLDILCTKAKCTILHHVSNNYMDAYILSESSLFIYKHRYIMKTCGTTTLLRCLGTLLQYADELGLELTWVGYSRKNLNNPSAQLWPHGTFQDEITYLTTHEHLQNRLRGTGHILGPITGDHWFVYVADHSETSPFYKIQRPLLAATPVFTPPSNERTINLMMFDMAPEVADIFYLKNSPSGKIMTKKSGIDLLCPGALIDEAAFTPCGYSMNAILHDAYFTIHITPEPQCSYVSFETNTCLDNYAAMIRNVLNCFRPKRFVLTMFGDQFAIDNMKKLPTDEKYFEMPRYVGQYIRTSASSTKADLELCCLMACYSFDNSRQSTKDMMLRGNIKKMMRYDAGFPTSGIITSAIDHNSNNNNNVTVNSNAILKTTSLQCLPSQQQNKDGITTSTTSSLGSGNNNNDNSDTIKYNSTDCLFLRDRSFSLI